MSYKYNNLTPFKWCVIENFPFIEADFDAITNYQLFCKVVEYLNKTITNTNILGAEVEKISNYFNTLNVQDEINLKLDEMAQDGTLQEIMSSYLNSKAVFGFENVESMKNATNLIDGSYAKTLGYYEKNDGGSAVYKIRNITNNDVIDGCDIISLNKENLIAELITNEICVNMYGAYGDGIHDDTQAIQKAFDNKRKLNVKFINNCNYLISNEIKLSNHIIINFNNAKITSNNENACIFISGNSKEIQTINDFYFDGNYISNYGLKVSDNKTTYCNSPKVKNCKVAGIYVFKNTTTGRGTIFANNILVQNHITTQEQYNALSNSIGLYIANTDSQILNGEINDCKTSIKCSSSTLIYGIHAWNYYEEFIKDGNIMVDANGGIRMIGCYCDGIPTMVKQNYQTAYSNIDISSCIYHYVIIDQSIDKFIPVPIIKGETDKVNISNSTFESDFYNQDFPIANNFKYLFVNNTYCSKTYYENYYKGNLTNEDIGTLVYERINDVVYYKFTATGKTLSGASFTEQLPSWAHPSGIIRMPLTDSIDGNVTISSNGEISNIKTVPWAMGCVAYPARYGLQKYNP